MPRRHYFNPRSPHGERHVSDDGKIDNLIFQSTLPARGATLRHMSFEPRQFLISIHAPRTGSDVPSERCIWIPARFQSTLPARGATLFKGSLAPTLGISIHAPRTGSDKDANWLARLVKISIHAPRTGSDLCRFPPTAPHSNFNPRSPHGERPSRCAVRHLRRGISIHAPRTGSDDCGRRARRRAADFNPRSPHGERRRASSRLRRGLPFQSTLPARGATAPTCAEPRRDLSFQSTLPARGATWQKGFTEIPQLFQSTLPARGATRFRPVGSHQQYFNPRSPHGERPPKSLQRAACALFQSTLPARGATCLLWLSDNVCPAISIHAPRTGSDLIFLHSRTVNNYFNPRSPHGERQHRQPYAGSCRDFNPRSPHGERLAIQSTAKAS